MEASSTYPQLQCRGAQIVPCHDSEDNAAGAARETRLIAIRRQ
jgi:hypothetical protein